MLPLFADKIVKGSHSGLWVKRFLHLIVCIVCVHAHTN